MKKMLKGIMSVAMVGAVAFSLAGCGGGDAGSSSEADNSSEDTAVETSSEGGTLIMGTNAEFPPYEYYDGLEVVGIDVEIANAIADKLGKELVVEDMEFGALIAAVTSGKIDMAMSGMTVTEERLQSVDFSDTYAVGVQSVIVKEDSEITTVDDLFGDNNYAVGVQALTTGDFFATWDIEDEGLGTVERYNKGADAVQALLTGRIDCVIIDDQPAKSFVSATDGLKLLDTEYAIEDYAIALDKNSPLTPEVNGALQELIADGTVGAIIEKYIITD